MTNETPASDAASVTARPRADIPGSTMSCSLDLPRRFDRFDALAIAGVWAFSAFVRLWGLGSIPPGLWFDEGLNGCDALAIARGGPWRMVFPEVFPREPLLVWLMVPFVHWMGPEILALRLPAALVGSLAPPLLYVWLRQSFGRKEALAAAVLLAGMRWHAHFSRMALRTIWTPTLALAFLALWEAALRSGRARWAIGAGVAFAAGFYTYLSWHFFVPVAAFAVVTGLWGASQSRAAALAGAFAVAAALAASPIAVHYVFHPEHLIGRPAEVSLFKNGVEPGLRAVARNARDASLMLFWKGDHVAKHNIPISPSTEAFAGRPALEPFGAALFALGLIWAGAALRRRSRTAAILLVWLVCGAGPTIFSYTDSPNFLRTLILSPVPAALGGLAVIRVSEALGRRRARKAPFVALAYAWVFAAVACMMWLYFGVWARMTELPAHFSGEAVQLAEYARAADKNDIIYAPPPIMGNFTFRFLTADAAVRPYDEAEALNAGEEERSRLILESPYIDPRVEAEIHRRFPGLEPEAQFPLPGAGEGEPAPIWARAWRLGPETRATGAAEADHR